MGKEEFSPTGICHPPAMQYQTPQPGKTVFPSTASKVPLTADIGVGRSLRLHSRRLQGALPPDPLRYLAPPDPYANALNALTVVCVCCEVAYFPQISRCEQCFSDSTGTSLSELYAFYYYVHGVNISWVLPLVFCKIWWLFWLSTIIVRCSLTVTLFQLFCIEERYF